MVEARIENGKLIIQAELDPDPKESKSGKSLVALSTNGFIAVDSDDGKSYLLNLNLITKK